MFSPLNLVCAVTHLSVDRLKTFIVGLSVFFKQIPREERKPLEFLSFPGNLGKNGRHGVTCEIQLYVWLIVSSFF